jgi:hypothetical protein
MRQIEFRGLRTDGKGWAYGDLLQPHQGNPDTFIAVDNGHIQPVNPSTVGQFTGLYDRNGVKIFEGDKHSDGGVVIWNADDASFCWYWEHVETVGMEGESSWAEITGNIHEPATGRK